MFILLLFQEALMYLSSSVRDFESLIETINLEAAWEMENKSVS